MITAPPLDRMLKPDYGKLRLNASFAATPVRPPLAGRNNYGRAVRISPFTPAADGFLSAAGSSGQMKNAKCKMKND